MNCPSSGSYEYAAGVVTTADALTAACPRIGCEQPAGYMCVYTSAQPSWNRQLGDPMQVAHPERKAVIRSRRLVSWRRARAPAPVIPASRNAREAAHALREFDRREYAQLRDWLREHGEILWRSQRPDGTFRGDTYYWS